MQSTVITRQFKYNGLTLADPGPSMPPAAVARFYAGQFPELATAVVEGPVTTNAVSVYTFTRAAGAKGGCARAVENEAASL